MAKKREYGFTLIVEGMDDITSNRNARKIYDACQPSGLGESCGRAHIRFDREASSFLHALKSALRDIKKVGLSAVAIEGVGLVTQSQIASNIGKTKQYVNQLATGKRGRGTFPLPVRTIGRGQLWSWMDVAQWLYSRTEISRDQYNEALQADMANTALMQKRQKSQAPTLFKTVMRNFSS